MRHLTSFIIILVSILLLPVAEPCMASSKKSAHLYNSRETLSGGYAEFCRDGDGYLWVGTERGLLRFDGNTYDSYIHDELKEGSISDNRILDLLCDSKGRLWVATGNGLNLYDRRTDTFRVIDIPNKLFNGYIIALDEQKDGTITFNFSGEGLYVINEHPDGEMSAVRYMAGLEGEKDFVRIECGKDGKMYIGDHDGNVHVVYANGSQKVIKVGDSYVNDMEIEADGNIIVNILNNLYRIDAKTHEVTKLDLPAGVYISKLSSSVIDDSIYVGTMGNGIWKIPVGKDIPVRRADIYSPFVNVDLSKVTALYGDPNGNLWLGCDYEGIVMVPEKGDPFVYHPLKTDNPRFIGGLCAIASSGENIVVGGENEHVSLFSSSGDLIRTYALPHGGYATSIEPVEGGKVLVGVESQGVWELTLATGVWQRVLEVPGKFPSVNVCSDGGDRIFVGIHGIGVMIYNRATGEKRWLEIDGKGDRLTNSFVTKMTRGDDDKIWIGLYGGVAGYDLKGDSLISIDQDPFLRGTTNSIVPLKNGNLLAGTSHGLIEFHPSKGIINKYTTVDGLSDNDVREVVIDKNGGRWMATMNGVSYQDPEGRAINAYYGSYGLVENSFKHGAVSKNGDLVYFTSDLGITSFNPSDVPTPNFSSDIKVSAIYLNGERVAPFSKTGHRMVIEGDMMKPDVLNLPYTDNALSLRLSTMDFQNGANLVYQWRVADMSDEWIETRPGENVITLPYLDPGTHTLQFRGVENSVMSDISEIKIRISPPWYLSWWAKILYFLVFAGICILAWILIKKRKEQKANDEKIKFFIDVSHDIRSPITLILGPLESLMKRHIDSDSDSKLKIIHRNCQRILSLVNQMLDIRKLEKGKMRLSCRRTNLPVFVEELAFMFRPQAEECGLTLQYENRSGDLEAWIDRDNLDKILVNLISNAIKYTPSGGEVKIVTEETDSERLGKCARISVIDTGIGLDSKVEAKIFERFYRVREDHAPATPGFGIGLDLCRRLVELHHGSISGRNREDGVKGSVFSILIPLSENAYQESELKYNEPPVEKEEGALKHLVYAPDIMDSTPDLASQRRSGSKRKVLVVDDYDELRDYICSQLEGAYKPFGARDGEEALKIITENTPDIIISDVMMPGIDGLELLKRVKSNAATSHIPVILLSSKFEVADRMAGWDRGADGYLGKPFNFEELRTMMDTLIENRLRMRGKYSGAQDTEGKITAPEVKGNDEKLMERIMKVIDKHIDNPDFSVEMLSNEVGISRAHLHRKMKESIGLTPSDFIRNIRLRRACELLQKPDIEVSQIAYLVGYVTQPHFSSAFKKFTGHTPSEYRAKCMSEGGVASVDIN